MIRQFYLVFIKIYWDLCAVYFSTNRSKQNAVASNFKYKALSETITFSLALRRIGMILVTLVH